MKKFQQNQKPLWRITARERRFILLIGDLIAIALGLLVALYFWAMGDQWLKFSWQFLKERPPNWYFFLPVIWLVLLLELYEPRRASRRDDTIRGIAVAAAICAVLYLIIFFVRFCRTFIFTFFIHILLKNSRQHICIHIKNKWNRHDKCCKILQ